MTANCCCSQEVAVSDVSSPMGCGPRISASPWDCFYHCISSVCAFFCHANEYFCFALPSNSLKGPCDLPVQKQPCEVFMLKLGGHLIYTHLQETLASHYAFIKSAYLKGFTESLPSLSERGFERTKLGISRISHLGSRRHTHQVIYICCMHLLQTTQGVQVNCFRTLEDLVLGYQHPHKGLVTPLLYPVPRDTDTGDESSGGSSRSRKISPQSQIHCTYNIIRSLRYSSLTVTV